VLQVEFAATRNNKLGKVLPNNQENHRMINTEVSRTLETPLGLMTMTANDDGITAIAFDPQDCLLPEGDAMTASPKLTMATLSSSLATSAFKEPSMPAAGHQAQSACAHLQQAADQLQQYFIGKRQQFTLTLAPSGSLFQQQVWQALSEIPFAHSCSYGAIATHLHNPKAVRAVGAANGRNPIAIVVPCHRVIGTNGSLTGYAGGLNRKLWLLQHELQHQTAPNSAKHGLIFD
jgi:methylated-DNA-[protein]-cysteine S-methyltransferase